MISIIQRVTKAEVAVGESVIGTIGQGIMALVAIEKTDSEKQADRLLERILNYRIFADENRKMNLSLRNINGGLLIVPQFTLAADTEKGNRPSFTSAASPQQSQQLFSYLIHRAHKIFPNSQTGRFGADMKVTLTNDGPVTFTLHVK